MMIVYNTRVVAMLAAVARRFRPTTFDAVCFQIYVTIASYNM